MRPYPAYKDSGIEWLSNIPKEWEVKRIGYLINFFTGYAFKSEFFSLEDGVKLVRGDNVTEGYLRWGDKTRYWNQITNDLEKFLLEPEDILIGMDGSKVGKNFCQVKKDELPLLLVQRVARLRVKNKLLSRFLFYNIASKNFLYWVAINKTDPAIPHISPKDIKDYTICLPNNDEQNQIAAFLDHKTKQIDNLINKKEKLIELLKEERTAIINQAVTKGLPAESRAKSGLDLHVPMKDSGIEWVGEIPEHWELRKLSRSFKIIGSGTTPKAGESKYYKNGEFSWVLTGDLNDGVLNQTSKKITQAALDDYSTLKFYPKGSIVIAMYGATIGKLSILGLDASTNQACCVISESDFFINQFLYYWLIAKKEDIIALSYGGGQPNISQEIIRFLKRPCPSLIDQKEIVEFLNIKTKQIDESVTKIIKEIDLIKEYKSSLINEAVTGKIDVREYKFEGNLKEIV